MLKKIPQSLSPELVKVLMEMGHGDEIILADGNFPAASHANQLVHCNGLMIPELLQAILELFTLDTYTKCPVVLMEVATGDNYTPEIWDTYRRILEESEEENINIEQLERFAFYKRSKKAYAIVTTSEKSLYANMILKKGVIVER
ncbi:L-fucose mutarotase [Gracilibacillus alcaliphilus]|uniref:L-fucose mutarotase n=1 Tax=Gracilibacillus alcaliphilus TaxID=1401441 RepID=UPI00195E485D|nr:L-fucose mutarotase [Gracilibacillus alcaliphilus]MBM7677178.1 L-fucose mutarotase [Gracilibacillus alcaliphilus]